jgi:hypothetical protein
VIAPLPLRERLSPWWQVTVIAALLFAAPTAGVVISQGVAGTHSAQRPVIPQAAPACSSRSRW